MAETVQPTSDIWSVLFDPAGPFGLRADFLQNLASNLVTLCLQGVVIGLFVYAIQRTLAARRISRPRKRALIFLLETAKSVASALKLAAEAQSSTEGDRLATFVGCLRLIEDLSKSAYVRVDTMRALLREGDTNRIIDILTVANACEISARSLASRVTSEKIEIGKILLRVSALDREFLLPVDQYFALLPMRIALLVKSYRIAVPTQLLNPGPEAVHLREQLSMA